MRAECVREGDTMKLSLFLNGERLTETRHAALGDLEEIGLFVYSENGGTDVGFDDVFVRRVAQRASHSGSPSMPTASAIRLM